MIFDAPLLLVVSPVIAGLLGGLAWLARSRRLLRAQAWAPEIGALARATGRWAPILIGIAALAAAVALAGPRGGRAQVTSETRALDLVFAVDISRSMLAEDVKPSRLERAAREIRRLTQDLAGDRLGLIAFAGRSYILTPLTVDAGAVTLFLDGLGPDLASRGGTNLGAALQQGTELLGSSTDAADRVLVVFTDGEAHDSLARTLKLAHGLRAQGVKLILVAEGQAQGARIPVRDSVGTLIGYQEDQGGTNIVTSRRDDILQAVADAAEGTLVAAELPDQAGAIRDLVAAFKRGPSTETSTEDLLPLAWIPLLIAVTILGLQTVTRRTAALVALSSLLIAPAAHSQSEARESNRRPSAAELALADGNPALASKAFIEAAGRHPSDTALYNAGTAALEANKVEDAHKDLGQASKSLDPGIRFRALYNLGTMALLRAVHDSAHRDELLDEAAARLEDALLLEPGSMAAKWNLELARRHKPPPKAGGGGGQSPPKNPNPESQAREQPTGAGDISGAQAEQILNSVEREERATLNQHLQRRRTAVVGVKDW